MPHTNPTIVLIPGAWHTAASYSLLTSHLEALHYPTVIIPLQSTLSTLSSPLPTSPGPESPSKAPSPPIHPPTSLFPTDVASIRETLTSLLAHSPTPLRIILVMHSYASVPASSALAALSTTARAAKGKQDGIQALLYIACRPLLPGQSMASVRLAPPADSARAFAYLAPPAQASALFYNDLPAADRAYWAGLLRMQSSSVFQGRATGAAWQEIRSFYLVCERDACVPAALQERWAAECGMVVRRVDAGHVPFVSAPAAVAGVVHEIAAAGREF